MNFGVCLGRVAPYYNLVLVVITIILFIKLIRVSTKDHFIQPWVYIFTGILVFVIETFFTIMRAVGIFDLPRIINPLFEMIMITLFIYAVLIQKEYIKNEK